MARVDIVIPEPTPVYSTENQRQIESKVFGQGCNFVR